MKFNDTSSFLEITPNVPIFLRSTSKGGFSAFADESLKNLNPVISFSPFSPINCTSFALICSLIGNSCFIVKHLLLVISPNFIVQIFIFA